MITVCGHMLSAGLFALAVQGGREGGRGGSVRACVQKTREGKTERERARETSQMGGVRTCMQMAVSVSYRPGADFVTLPKLNVCLAVCCSTAETSPATEPAPA